MGSTTGRMYGPPYPFKAYTPIDAWMSFHCLRYAARRYANQHGSWVSWEPELA